MPRKISERDRRKPASRKREWFDDESFWRHSYSFMFPERRFNAAAEEVDLALRLTKPKGRMALDLCCGPGRCSVALAKRGFKVTGVDKSSFLLKKGRALAKASGAKIEWVCNDMRDFVRPGNYDLVLNMFTSFGFFDNKKEDLVVLKNIFANLRPGGSCIIDILGKEQLSRSYQPTNSEILPDGRIIVMNHEIFDDWTRIQNEWIFIRRGKAKRFRFHLTIYSGQELKDRLQQAGFVGVKLFGNLDGNNYGLDAQRLIAVAKKPR